MVNIEIKKLVIPFLSLLGIISASMAIYQALNGFEPIPQRILFFDFALSTWAYFALAVGIFSVNSYLVFSFVDRSRRENLISRVRSVVAEEIKKQNSFAYEKEELKLTEKEKEILRLQGANTPSAPQVKQEIVLDQIELEENVTVKTEGAQEIQEQKLLPYITLPDGSEPPEPIPFTSSKEFRIAGSLFAIVVGIVTYLIIVLR